MILTKEQAALEMAKASVLDVNEDERVLYRIGYDFKVCWIAADGHMMVNYHRDAIMANSFARDLPSSRHAMLFVNFGDGWAKVEIVGH